MKKKNKTIFFVFVSLSVLLISTSSCWDSGSQSKSGAEQPAQITLNSDYTGTLKLVYSRDFPGFNAVVEIDVDVYKSGDVLLSQPSSAVYDATEDDGSLRIREQGSVTVTSLSGYAVELGGQKYIRISANTLITGVMTAWIWEDGWVQVLNVPFTHNDPVESPMNFDLAEAALSTASIGKSIPAYGGTQTFKWTLTLSGVL